jgi:DNA repair protein RadC
MKVAIYRTQLVRENSAKYRFERVTNSDTAKRVSIQLLEPILIDSPQEQFWVITFDIKLKVTGLHHITTGTLDSTIVHPREVFRAAFLDSAHSIMTVHNHPSGDVTPSQADMSMFGRLNQASELLGIRVIDHLVLGWDDDGKADAYSFAGRI